MTDTKPSVIGHNGGPPLEDEQPGYLWRKHLWTKAYKQAWKTPSMAVLKFRVARAEAAGVTYEQYMLELLDTGRHLQKDDGLKQAGPGLGGDKRRRAAAKPLPLGGPAPAPTAAAQDAGPAQARGARPVPQPLGGSFSGPSTPPRRK